MKVSNTVERNQNFIAEMPKLLERLVFLMVIGNYGPTLGALMNHDMASVAPLAAEVLQFTAILGSDAEGNEWELLRSLHEIVENSRRTPPSDASTEMPSQNHRSSNGSTSASAPVRQPPNRSVALSFSEPRPRDHDRMSIDDIDDFEEDYIMQEILDTFSHGAAGGQELHIHDLYQGTFFKNSF